MTKRYKKNHLQTISIILFSASLFFTVLSFFTQWAEVVVSEGFIGDSYFLFGLPFNFQLEVIALLIGVVYMTMYYKTHNLRWAAKFIYGLTGIFILFISYNAYDNITMKNPYFFGVEAGELFDVKTGVGLIIYAVSGVLFLLTGIVEGLREKFRKRYSRRERL